MSEWEKVGEWDDVEVTPELIKQAATDSDDLYGDDPTNTRKLLPELQMFLTRGPLGKILKHPLVFQVPFFYSWKLANRSYELKLERLIEAESIGDWTQALFWYERPWRFHFLKFYWAHGFMNEDELREQLAWVWTDAEFPWQHGHQEVLKLFKSAGFISDAPWAKLLNPEDEYTIYRGCQPRHKRGFSWTLDEKKARWFAQRLDTKGTGRTYKTTIKVKHWLGYFEGRNEQEVVVQLPRGHVITELE